MELTNLHANVAPQHLFERKPSPTLGLAFGEEDPKQPSAGTEGGVLESCRRENSSEGGIPVKAVRTHGRGGPEQLFFEDAPAPVVRPGDVLVRVRATGITPAELTWEETYRNADGTPRIPGIPGHEPSGVVEETAPDVTDFRAGDEIYGLADFPRDGAAAEFAAVRAANLALKPRSIPHVQAAALPLSALTAWQALFEHAHLAAGQAVLIHGGAGGVGTLAVQLARWRGARVLA